MMRCNLTFLAVLTTTACLCGAARAAKPSSGEQSLFNGKDLSGWDYFLVDPDATMKDVWSVQDGSIICKGEPRGYLCTKKDFKNFELTVQWRWAPGTEPGNSGVLMRITGEPMMLPRCVEAQLQSDNAGDMYGFQGFKIDGDPARKSEVPDHKLGGQLTGLTRIEGNENEPGEWNSYLITARGGTITLLVNGKRVNQATGCDVRAGKIGLQSEGGVIHFRAVKLVPLDE